MALTPKDLQAIEQLLDKKLDEKLEPIKVRQGVMQERLEGIQERQEAMQERLEAMQERLEAMREQLAVITEQQKIHARSIMTLENKVMRELQLLIKYLCRALCAHFAYSAIQMC